MAVRARIRCAARNANALCGHPSAAAHSRAPIRWPRCRHRARAANCRPLCTLRRARPLQVLSVDLATGAVDKVTTLSVRLFDALWATCDGSGVIGGVTFGASAGQAEFGTVDASGSYTKKATVSVADGFVPSGLLTATSPASYQDAFIAAFYPPGSLTNASHAEGLLWTVDPYGGGTDDDTHPINYMLIAASWDRGGR